MSLLRYRREFEIWLEEFRETDIYSDIVDCYLECWPEIYKELHRIFKKDVWEPCTMDYKYKTCI